MNPRVPRFFGGARTSTAEWTWKEHSSPGKKEKGRLNGLEGLLKSRDTDPSSQVQGVPLLRPALRSICPFAALLGARPPGAHTMSSFQTWLRSRAGQREPGGRIGGRSRLPPPSPLSSPLPSEGPRLDGRGGGAQGALQELEYGGLGCRAQEAWPRGTCGVTSYIDQKERFLPIQSSEWKGFREDKRPLVEEMES